MSRKRMRNVILRNARISGSMLASSAAELNILDGATLDVNELNALDGITSSVAELNILDGVTATATELNKLASVTAGTAAASKAAVLGANKNLDVLAVADGGLSLGAGAGTAITATAAELNKTDGIAAAAYLTVAAEVTFTETAGAGTYTGSVTVPAGATILDVIVNGVALWNTQTSATMKVGDTDDDGFYTGIDLKDTDLLAGESLSFALAGGKAGAYIANSQISPRYSATQRVVSGIVTTVGSTGSAGRTRMTVVYALSLATPAAATKA